MDGTGTILKQYINGTSVIGSVYGAGNELYYLYDGLGSVIAVTDAAGTMVAAYDYDAFGALKSETGSVSNDLKFTGEQSDAETGLIYLRARMIRVLAGFLPRILLPAIPPIPNP